MASTDTAGRSLIQGTLWPPHALPDPDFAPRPGRQRPGCAAADVRNGAHRASLNIRSCPGIRPDRNPGADAPGLD